MLAGAFFRSYADCLRGSLPSLSEEVASAVKPPDSVLAPPPKPISPTPSLQQFGSKPPVSYPPARPPYLSHKVRPGQTLESIAQHYRTSVHAIRKANGLTSNLIPARTFSPKHHPAQTAIPHSVGRLLFLAAWPGRVHLLASIALGFVVVDVCSRSTSVRILLVRPVVRRRNFAFFFGHSKQYTQLCTYITEKDFVLGKNARHPAVIPDDPYPVFEGVNPNGGGR